MLKGGKAVKHTLLFFVHLLRTSIKASISKRGAFLIESGLMLANNLIFFTIWWVFFRQFNDVAGWSLQDMVILMGVGTMAYGLMQVCFGGVKSLSRMILNGDLDPFMTQPKNLILHVVGSKSYSKGWGHIITGFILLGFGGVTTVYTFPLIVISILSGCLVFLAVNVSAHSLPFWMGSVEGVSSKYCDSLFLFALYPTNIYSGLLQVVMFTLIPAGIITYLPVELIRHFSWTQLFILTGSSLFFVALAVFIFYSGLKRYQSGNKFGTRL